MTMDEQGFSDELLLTVLTTTFLLDDASELGKISAKGFIPASSRNVIHPMEFDQIV